MPVMQIIYRGGPRGVYALAQELKAQGIDARYVPPEEQRGAAEVAFYTVVFNIVWGAVEDEAKDAVRSGARKAIARLKAS